MSFEPDRLDDQTYLTETDAGGMLPAIASAAAHVRTGYRSAVEGGVAGVAEQLRPRAVAVAGVGTGAIAGDLLAAVCGRGTPIPLVTVRSHALPGWVGAADLVIAASASEETLAVASEAVRRGAFLLAVGKPDSPLHAIATQGSGLFVPVPVTGQERANLWLLAVPLIMAAASLRLVEAGADLFENVAKSLEDVAHRCRPSSESFINPGKTLATELAESVPMIWGSSPVAAVAAERMAAQLEMNAKYPAILGDVPGVSLFDGPFAERDIFADEAERSLRLVLLRDADEHPREARRREAAMRMAQDRSVPVTELAAQGEHPVERLASLIELGDYASAYLALGYGIDPTPVSAITELAARISQ